MAGPRRSAEPEGRHKTVQEQTGSSTLKNAEKRRPIETEIADSITHEGDRDRERSNKIGEAMNMLNKVMNPLNLDKDNQRVRVGMAAVREAMKLPVRNINARWKLHIEQFANGDRSYNELIEDVRYHLDELERYTKIAEYFVKWVQKRNEGVTKNESLRFLEENVHKLSAVMDSKLENALLWSLGYVENGSLAGRENFSMRVLADRLYKDIKRGPASSPYQGEITAIVFTAVSHLSSRQKIEFFDNFITKHKDIGSWEDLLHVAVSHGAIGVPEVKEIYQREGKAYEEDLQEEHLVLYQNATDFKNSTEQVYINSIGSTNAAGEMITYANTAKTVFKTAAVMTILSNYGVAGVKVAKGELTIGEALANPLPALAIGGLVALKLNERNEAIGVELRSVGEDKTRREVKAQGLMYHAERGNRGKGWLDDNGFFAMADYAGARAFGDFILDLRAKYKEDIPKFALSTMKFKEYLEDHKKERGYEQLSEKLDDMLKNSPSDAWEFTTLAMYAEVFTAYSIGGATAKNSYLRLINDAANYVRPHGNEK